MSLFIINCTFTKKNSGASCPQGHALITSASWVVTRFGSIMHGDLAHQRMKVVFLLFFHSTTLRHTHVLIHRSLRMTAAPRAMYIHTTTFLRLPSHSATSSRRFSCPWIPYTLTNQAHWVVHTNSFEKSLLSGFSETCLLTWPFCKCPFIETAKLRCSPLKIYFQRRAYALSFS